MKKKSNRLVWKEPYHERDDYFAIGLTQFEPPSEDENALVYNPEQDAERWIEEHKDKLC